MIFITGCARSGTSLTTGILARCGANLGPVNVLNESMAAREGVVKPYLRSIGADPACQHPLPDPAKLRPAPDWRAKITKAIGQPEPWAYKCAKSCLFWPLWVEHFPEAKWVIVRRDRERIIDSCLRTSFMQKHTTREGWGGWVDTHLERFEELKANADCIEVWARDYMADPEAFRPVAEHCGLAFKPEYVAQAVEPAKWHG